MGKEITDRKGPQARASILDAIEKLTGEKLPRASAVEASLAAETAVEMRAGKLTEGGGKR